MLSEAQVRKISLLSDNVLYHEAVDFIRHLVREEECSPLSSKQTNGLLNIASVMQYDKLREFVIHQRDRNWPASKADIKTFYTELEKYLALMQKKRLKDEFGLVTEGLSVQAAREEVKQLMAALVYDFVQHLVIENGLLVAERANSKGQGKREERDRQKQQEPQKYMSRRER